MSGSKDKNTRKEHKVQGMDYRSSKDIQEEKANQKNKRSAITFLIVFVVVAVAVLIMNTGMFHRSIAAVEVNGASYSVVEFNYYYFTAYQNEMYNGYGSYYIDKNKPLSSQTYISDESMTWADYFKDTAIKNMRTTAMLLDQAEEAGMTELDEENQADLDQSIEDVKTAADKSDYTSVNKYLAEQYGKGMNLDYFTEIMTRVYLAAQYSQSIQDGFTDSYTDEELEAYYQENADKYDLFTYRSYFVADATANADAEAATQEEDTTVSEGMIAARAIADTIAAAQSEDEFISLVYDNASEDTKETYAEDDATLSTDVTGSSISSNDYGEWLQDSSRQNGDITVVESDTGYYVVYFAQRSGNEVELVDLRHILLSVQKDDTTVTEETDTEADANALADAETAALAKAEEILAEWEQGTATEESFGALADEYSDDTSAGDGGLYENVYPGQMTTEFNDWIFDESRQTGDVEIVKTESYGYHIIYYIGQTGQTYRNYIAQQSKLSEDYQAWSDEQLENYSYSLRFFIRFAM